MLGVWKEAPIATHADNLVHDFHWVDTDTRAVVSDIIGYEFIVVTSVTIDLIILSVK